MSQINASVSGASPITASVGETQIDAAAGGTAAQVDVSVSGGFGPSGSNGAAGAAATVAVGTVTTGSPGSSATVTNVGSSSAAVLNFTIPAGAAGTAGAAGAAGAAGPAGSAGVAGAAASIAVGTVATGSPASVTNVGTTAAAVLNFTIPAGAAGPQGPAGDPATNLVTSVAGRTGTITLAVADVSNAVSASDARLTDARTPTAHKTSHSTGGTDALSPADIGAAIATHTHAASDTTSGTFDLARIPTGTTSTTVSLGNHTHTQLHDRSHAITSSSDHTATAWRVFYSDASGVVTELALGSSGQALLSQGASAAPTWGSAGSTSASDLSSGTLANARLSSRARAAINTHLWSSFR